MRTAEQEIWLPAVYGCRL